MDQKNYSSCVIIRVIRLRVTQSLLNVDLFSQSITDGPSHRFVFRSVNGQMKNGVTPAYLACQEGHMAVLKYLVLQAGASVKIPASDGMTCVHSAAQSGNLDVLMWLVRAV